MSDLSILSSRAIMGMYFARLEVNPGLAWVNAVSNLFTSDQESETYAFLGQSPAMREWIGGRQAKGLTGTALTIANRHYEATLEIAVRDARRDKTPQIEARVQDFADRSLTHWASLLSALIAAGETTICYEGQYFFDTDHSEGKSGAQSNDISVDISELTAQLHGTPAAPSIEEFQQTILRGITQIISVKDDQGEPMNESASSFLVMVPASLYMVAVAACSTLTTAALQNNLNPNLVANERRRLYSDIVSVVRSFASSTP
jgi:hypothetical protein